MPKVKDLLEKLEKFNPEAEVTFVTHVDGELCEIGDGPILLETELLEDEDAEIEAGIVIVSATDGSLLVCIDTNDELTFNEYGDDEGYEDE